MSDVSIYRRVEFIKQPEETFAEKARKWMNADLREREMAKFWAPRKAAT